MFVSSVILVVSLGKQSFALHEGMAYFVLFIFIFFLFLFQVSLLENSRHVCYNTQRQMAVLPLNKQLAKQMQALDNKPQKPTM